MIIDTGLSPGTPVIGTLTAEATLNQDTMNYHKSCYQRVCITHFALFWSKAPVPVSWLRELGILSVTGTLNKLRSSSENSEAQVLEECRQASWIGTTWAKTDTRFWLSLPVVSPTHNARNPHFIHRNSAQHHHCSQVGVLPSSNVNDCLLYLSEFSQKSLAF